MHFENKTEDTTFAEAVSETPTQTIATPQNLPALSSAGNLTAPPMPEDEPAPAWEKNYTNLVQFSDPEITKAAIESITKRCSKIERLSAEAIKRLWLAVAESVVIFHLSDQKTIDASCRDAGIKKPNKRGNGKRPIRHFVRLVTGRLDDPTFDDDKRNANNKEVGRYARYFDISLDMLVANPEHFYNDPVRKLVEEIERRHGLERFVKDDERETDDHTDDQSSKSQAATPAIAASTRSNEIPAAHGTHLAAPTVSPGPTAGDSTDDEEPEYWPLIPQQKIDGSEPDKPRVADVLGDRMGCFLFQLPPSYRYTKARLNSILNQLDRSRRNVVEFRHKSWWNETVYAAFRESGTIFCSCSGPRLPDVLVRTADDVYLRMHGPVRWYRHDYSSVELKRWAGRITASGAKRTWIYFNNDYEANAPRNAATMRRLLAKLVL